MASGHRDVNLPPHTVHLAGTSLSEFEEWLVVLGMSIWTVDKPPGNHLTDFWAYAWLDSSRPEMSKVSFGCTRFAAVNPQIHAYARGKGEYLAAAVKLLESFISEVWAFEQEEQHATAPGEPTMPTPQDSWDQWEVLDLGQFRCPSTERLWFSTDDAAFWFMPEADGLSSACGRWKKYQDSLAGNWWCNEGARKLFFQPTA